jgi:hypothetical protein
MVPSSVPNTIVSAPSERFLPSSTLSKIFAASHAYPRLLE